MARIRVVCTGRGSHREISFPDVTLDDEGRFAASKDEGEPPFTVTTVHGQLHITWQWKCRKCGRHTQVSDTKHPDFWPRIYQARTAGVLEQLDISALPF